MALAQEAGVKGMSVNGRENATLPRWGRLVMAAAVALSVAGCSDVIFPAVHDMPGPRADTPLTPEQVKQATDDLICEREHLSTEAGSGPPGAPANPAGKSSSACPPQATGSAPAVTPSAYARP
jgi:hypothetical protein